MNNRQHCTKGGYLPAPPAAFTLSSLSISPAKVMVSETVDISIVITNSGGQSSSYEVTLRINGQVEEIKDITLLAGSSEQVSFTVVRDAAGSYSVLFDHKRTGDTVNGRVANGAEDQRFKAIRESGLIK
ncbi:MAG: CARDB domain-containing protein [Dehalococcoidia bacterium]|nr:CARDB domain-containing protein [Dehalococcoidia bacterium]